MNVKLLTLDNLRATSEELEEDEFMREFPGIFLLAMGFLSTAVIRARTKGTKKALQGSSEGTAAISFGAKLKHDANANHPLAGCAFFIEEEESARAYLLGRGNNCDLTIPDESVSETHCRIDLMPDFVTVTDLSSTNGTTLNLERLQPQQPSETTDESILTVGRYSFQVLRPKSLYAELELLRLLDN